MTAIVNASLNWGIGKDGALLYPIPEDMRFFRRMTQGQVVVMGSGTLSSFPGQRPLKDRVNIILSRRAGFAPEGFLVCRDLSQLRDTLGDFPGKEIFVIGGQQIYALLIAYCDKAYVTRVKAHREADAFFPDLDALPGWELAESSPESQHEGVSFCFCTYHNHAPAPL